MLLYSYKARCVGAPPRLWPWVSALLILICHWLFTLIMIACCTYRFISYTWKAAGAVLFNTGYN